MEVKEISSTNRFKVPSESERAKALDLMKKQRKEGEKLVKGMFEFIDAQGGWLDFSIRLWPGEPIRTIRITHGEICDVPMSVVKHLNNCYKKVRAFPDNWNCDQRGPADMKFVTKYSRTRFTPIDVL